jgi:dolichol-phosphate mannosyltransferase
MEMDADFSHNPEDVPRLIEAAKKYDLVIGRPLLHNGVNIINWPFKRSVDQLFCQQVRACDHGMPRKMTLLADSSVLTAKSWKV